MIKMVGIHIRNQCLGSVWWHLCVSFVSQTSQLNAHTHNVPYITTLFSQLTKCQFSIVAAGHIHQTPIIQLRALLVGGNLLRGKCHTHTHTHTCAYTHFHKCSETHTYTHGSACQNPGVKHTTLLIPSGLGVDVPEHDPCLAGPVELEAVN